MNSKRHKPVTAELAPEQVEALSLYIERVGKHWKNQLALDWSRAGTRVHGVEYAYLHQLRNHYGFAWLETYNHDIGSTT